MRRHHYDVLMCSPDCITVLVCSELPDAMLVTAKAALNCNNLLEREGKRRKERECVHVHERERES